MCFSTRDGNHIHDYFIQLILSIFEFTYIYMHIIINFDIEVSIP